jgi:hypothetical protein
MALRILGFVNSKTEEFLNLLLWSAEQLMRPTFRNLTDSYEAWAYRHGLLKLSIDGTGTLVCPGRA